MSSAPLPSRLGGTRVMRRCAAGERADVLLLHGSDVVAKVYREPTAPPEELQVLGRLRHRHVVELRDVETLDDGRLIAYLTRCRRGSLADWLAGRDGLAPGEAVTILAPLCAAVAALRSAGVVHGRVDPRRVLLDDGGAPVLVGFGRAMRPGAAPVGRGPGSDPGLDLDADLDALVRMADAVLARVGSASADAIRQLVAEREVWEVPDALVTALFDWTAGEPLRFGDPVPGAARERAIPVLPAREPVCSRLPRTTLSRRPERPSAGTGGLGPRIAVLAESDPPRRLRAALTRRWSGAPPRLRRLVVAGAAGAVGACLVASLVQSGASTAEPAPTRTIAAPVPSAPSTAAATPNPATTSTASPGSADAVVSGPDPLAALPILLRVREGCLRELDAECLDAVDETGSPALVADRVVATRGGGAPIPDASKIGAARDMGGAVAVDVGGTEVLLIRGADGWRVRAVTSRDAAG